MFTCPLCAKTFGTQQVLKSHIFTHTKEKPHKCLTCSETFGYLASLNTHIQTIHNALSFQCQVCGHKSTSRGNLKQHLLKHSTELPISCTMPSCSFKTKSHKQLQGHVRRVHLREAPHACKIVGCNYKTSVAGNLSRHLKVHNNEKPFACQVPGCDYTCKVQPYLTVHIASTHSNEKLWKCSICGFQTKLRSTLNSHRDTHSSIKRFQCQSANCRYASNSKTGLMMHFDRKHRKKEILCTEPRCKYRCGSTALLKIHLKDHELPIWKCPIDSCNYSTRFKKDLLHHTSRSRNHGDDQYTSLLLSGKSDPANSDPTVAVVETRNCPFPNCGYQTDFPHRYDRHIMSHHDQEKRREFFCKFCPSRFTRLKSLEGHIQRHLREKHYNCPHCDYTAIDGDSLRCHARRIHRIFVIPRGAEHQFERKCRICNLTSSSYSEFVLHSMIHLRPVVMLERLRVHDG